MRSHRAYDISTIIIFRSEPAAKNISHIKLSYKSDPFQPFKMSAVINQGLVITRP